MVTSTIRNEAGNSATLPMVAMEKELSEVDLQEGIILADSSSYVSSDDHDNNNGNSKNNTHRINNPTTLSERKSKSGNNSRTRRSSSVIRATKKLFINKTSYSTITIRSTKKEKEKQEWKEKQEKKEERYLCMKTNNNAMMNSRMSTSLGMPYDLELERGGAGGTVFERKEELNKEQEEREEEVEICFFDDENWRDKLEVHNGNDETETESAEEKKYEMNKSIIENCYKHKEKIVEFEEEEEEEEEEDYAIQSFDNSLLEVSDNLDRALQDIVNHEHETTTTTADNSKDTFNRFIERRKKEQNRHDHGNSNNNRNQNWNQNNSGNTIISFYSSDEEDEDEEDTNNNCGAPYKLAPGSVSNTVRYRLWNACSGTDGETKIMRRIVCVAGMGLLVIVVLFSIIMVTAVHTTNHSSSLRGDDPAIIAVGYNDYNWNELPLTVQNAATKLGWKQQSWNRNIETEVYKKEWEELSKEQKAAATLLGFQKGTWCTDNDDNYNHNDDDDDEGTEKVPTYTSVLDTTTVPDTTTNPETKVDDYLYRDVDWMELPTDLKNVAIAMGYNQELWDAGDRNRGTNNILPPLDTGIVDTNGDPLTNEEHKDASLLMNTINNIQQQQASTLASLLDDTSSSGTMNTLPETTTDDFFYCDKNWIDLTQELQQLAMTLGYTQEIWDTPGDNIPQETFDTNWGQLTSAEQKNAAIMLFGYNEETWIDDPVWEDEYSDQIMNQLNMKQQSSSSVSTPETITIPDKESDDDDDNNDNDDQSKDVQQPSTSSSVVRVVPATKSPATTTQKRNDEDWIELSKHHHHYPV